MRILSLLLLTAGFAIAPPAARAEDIAGSLILHVTETPASPSEGVLARGEVVAIHELRADRGAVLLENAARGLASSRAGAVLIAINSGPRMRLYCDLNTRNALSGGFATCYEDQDGDGRLETRYLGSTRVTTPSTFFAIAAPDTIEPAAYREAEPNERPIVHLGFRPCTIGRQPTFKIVVSTVPDQWSNGGPCQPAEQVRVGVWIDVSQGLSADFAVQSAEGGVAYRLTHPLAAGSDVVLLPQF